MKDKEYDQVLTPIAIKDGDYLPFVARTENLGTAEFVICPIWKRNKLVKLHIYPKQQELMDYYYVWEGYGRHSLQFSGYQGLQDPKIWYSYFCKEHKCLSLRLYVPPESSYIWFTVYSDNITIGFTKTN
jgi:hypothetical protein